MMYGPNRTQRKRGHRGQAVWGFSLVCLGFYEVYSEYLTTPSVEVGVETPKCSPCLQTQFDVSNEPVSPGKICPVSHFLLWFNGSPIKLKGWLKEDQNLPFICP